MRHALIAALVLAAVVFVVLQLRDNEGPLAEVKSEVADRGLQPSPVAQGVASLVELQRVADSEAAIRTFPPDVESGNKTVQGIPVAGFLRHLGFALTEVPPTSEQVASLESIQSSLGLERQNCLHELASAMMPIIRDICKDDQKFAAYLQQGTARKITDKRMDMGSPPRAGDCRMAFTSRWDGVENARYVVWLYVDEHQTMRRPWGDLQQITQEIERSIVAIAGPSVRSLQRRK